MPQRVRDPEHEACRAIVAQGHGVAPSIDVLHQPSLAPAAGIDAERICRCAAARVTHRTEMKLPTIRQIDYPVAGRAPDQDVLVVAIAQDRVRPRAEHLPRLRAIQRRGRPVRLELVSRKESSGHRALAAAARKPGLPFMMPSAAEHTRRATRVGPVVARVRAGHRERNDPCAPTCRGARYTGSQKVALIGRKSKIPGRQVWRFPPIQCGGFRDLPVRSPVRARGSIHRRRHVEEAAHPVG